MKLYYSKGACSLVVRIIINEIGIHSEYESVNLKTKETATHQNFLAINPKGAVPTLELQGEILTENLVIQQYLADEYEATELLPPVRDIRRYQILACSNFITTEIHKNFSNLFNPTIPQELKDSIYTNIIKNKLGFLNDQLENNPYLMGDHFTLPDAYLFVMLLWAKKFKINLTEWNRFPDYSKTLQNRPSIIKSLEEEEITFNFS